MCLIMEKKLPQIKKKNNNTGKNIFANRYLFVFNDDCIFYNWIKSGNKTEIL